MANQNTLASAFGEMQKAATSAGCPLDLNAALAFTAGAAAIMALLAQGADPDRLLREILIATGAGKAESDRRQQAARMPIQ